MSQGELITLIYKKWEKDTSDWGPVCTEYCKYNIGKGTAVALRAAIEENKLKNVESLNDHLILESHVIWYGRDRNMFLTLSAQLSDVFIK